MEGYKLFLAFLASALLLGVLSVVFALVWVLHYREGLAWDGDSAEFNWHPVLIITGFVFIQGIGIIVYRLPWTWKCSKFLMKLIHAGLHTVALTLAIISLVAVFDYHNAKMIPNMYSLHSWIGLTAVILYALQLVLGFVVFLLPFAPTSLRTAVMPIHTYSGLFIFGTVIATALMGITEKLIFSLRTPSYSNSPEEAIFVNVLGVLIVAYGAVILWMATRPHWKRPLEHMFQTHQRIGEGFGDDDCHSSDLEFNSEGAARKRTPKSDEAEQRSTS
ncbi:plasma membrane ascorbate-dependent reductase CYBRD1 [Ahaetulla prasina]|uniref:plasma membrane ascorbate-dependent reductase CYBRD1 n=1 Tax=Ahaetulla prasina TaxID=499056 RepID=UPI002649B480|nr:plasma membrane ascorbate-dependent reductase CYBRD1 [Ahaetulla prasina]